MKRSRRKNIRIETYRGIRHVDGWVFPEAGLIVHRELLSHPTKDWIEGSGWRVSHESGRWVTPHVFDSLKKATEAVDALYATGIDWHQPTEQLRRDRKARERSGQAIAALLQGEEDVSR